MNFPKLKNPRLCQTVMWLTIIGVPVVAASVICCVNVIGELAKTISLLVILGFSSVWLIFNFGYLYITELFLKTMDGIARARKRYVLGESFNI